MEHFGGFGGGWFGLVRLGGLWYCGFAVEREREVWFVLISGDLEQDLFDEPLIYRNSEHSYTPMYIKKSQFPLLPYLPVSSSPSSNKQHYHHRKES